MIDLKNFSDRFNRKGVTIIEAVASMALLSMIGLGVFTGSSFLMKMNSQSTQITDEAKVIQILVENLKSSPTLQQIDFSPNNEDAFLDLNKLPIGFGPDFLGPRELCDTGIDLGPRTNCDSKCAGYIGYRLTPLQANSPGLIQVKILIYNFKKSVCEATVLDKPDVKTLQFVTQAK